MEDTLLTLWDTDGTTVLHVNDDTGRSFFPNIEWTSPKTGTYFVTVENADFLSMGAYTLVVQGQSP